MVSFLTHVAVTLAPEKNLGYQMDRRGGEQKKYAFMWVVITDSAPAENQNILSTPLPVRVNRLSHPGYLHQGSSEESHGPKFENFPEKF